MRRWILCLIRGKFIKICSEQSDRGGRGEEERGRDMTRGVGKELDELGSKSESPY
jgi:hypothetical protein